MAKVKRPLWGLGAAGRMGANSHHTYIDMPWIPTGFPGGSDHKQSACNAGDLGSIPGWGRSRAGGNGNPLQYSRLKNPMEERAWWATVHRVSKSETRMSN